MNWPGEKLLICLVELIEKSGAGLLKPWQLKRVGKAEIDVAGHRMIAIVAAEKKIEALRNHGSTELLKIAVESPALSSDNSMRLEPTLESAILVNDFTASQTVEYLRKEVNVEKAISHAEKTLRDDSSEPSEHPVEIDWFFRWREYAAGVSSESLQQLWGNVLAGELKEPGSFTYRTLDFLRGLAQDEAKLIERLATIVIEDVRVIHGQSFTPKKDVRPIDVPLSDSELMMLEEIGVLSGVPILGYTDEKSPFQAGEGRYIHLLACRGRGIAAITDEPIKKTKLGFYQVTKLGVSVLKLVQATPDEDHLLSIGRRLVQSGFNVEIGDVIDNRDGTRRFQKTIAVTLPDESAS